MSKSDYDWDIVKHEGQEVLSIIDLNRGRMTVTNNIENVIAEIKQELAQQGYILPSLIIYKDSDNCWDGWDFVEQDFIFLFEKSSQSAIEKLIRKNEKKIDVSRS